MSAADLTLRQLYALAYLEQLDERNGGPAELPAAELPARVRVDDTGRAPVVPLYPAGGDRG